MECCDLGLKVNSESENSGGGRHLRIGHSSYGDLSYQLRTLVINMAGADTEYGDPGQELEQAKPLCTSLMF